MSYLLPIQQKIYQVLLNNNIRIYDAVPDTAQFPYVTFGPSDEVEDDADCIESVRLTLQLDVWSKKSGKVEAAQIASQIRSLLHRQNIVLSGAALVEIEVSNIRTFYENDGVTAHAAITTTSHIEKGI